MTLVEMQTARAWAMHRAAAQRLRYAFLKATDSRDYQRWLERSRLSSARARRKGKRSEPWRARFEAALAERRGRRAW